MINLVLDVKPRATVRKVLDSLVESGHVSYVDRDYYRRRDAFMDALAADKSLVEAMTAALHGLDDAVQKEALAHYGRLLLNPETETISVPAKNKTSSLKEHVKTFGRFSLKMANPRRRIAATTTEGK